MIKIIYQSLKVTLKNALRRKQKTYQIDVTLLNKKI